MRDGMLNRLTRGTAVTLMRQVINVFGQIVLVPVYLKYWGNQLYGEWQLLSAAVAYLTLLDFGMQTFAVNRMNQCYSTGNLSEFRRIFQTALFFSLAVSGVAAAALMIAIAFMPVEQWFHLEQTARRTGMLALIALGLQFTCSLPAGVVGGVYRAVGEYSRDVLFNNIARASVLVATAVLLITGGGILSIATVQLVGLIAHILFVQWDLRRRHPEIEIGIAHRDVTLALSFLGPSSLFFLMQISGALTVQGTTLLMGAIAGAGMVAVLVALRALANCIPQVAQALGATLWPELTALEARRDYGKLRATYLVASKLLLGFGLTAGVFLYFASADIVRWWTGGRIQFDPMLMTALILLQVCQSWYLTSTVLLGSSNNHKRLAFCQIASSVTGLAVGAALGKSFGPAALLWGLVGAEVLISCWAIPLMACRVAKQNPGQYLVEVLGKGVVFCGTLYGAMWAVSFLIPSGSLERILFFGILSGLAAAITLTVFWLDRDQRRWVRGALRLRAVTG